MATHAGLSELDFVVIVAYFVGVIAVGVWVSLLISTSQFLSKVFVELYKLCSDLQNRVRPS